MSRYPAMNQAPLPYDRSLLAAAPALTRQDRQAGYDVNALEQGTYPQQSTTIGRQPVQAQAQAPAPVAPPADPFRDSYDERDYSPTPGSEKQRPWWKRKRWAALALIIFIGIICGIIAGVVTAKNARNTSALAANPQNENAGISPPSATSSSPLPTAATPSRTTPALTTSDPRNGNGGTTVVFGGHTTTLPPGVVLPTATGRPAPTVLDPGSGDDDEIPEICYITPRSRDCAPYFEDGP